MLYKNQDKKKLITIVVSFPGQGTRLAGIVIAIFNCSITCHFNCASLINSYTNSPHLALSPGRRLNFEGGWGGGGGGSAELRPGSN